MAVIVTVNFGDRGCLGRGGSFPETTRIPSRLSVETAERKKDGWVATGGSEHRFGLVLSRPAHLGTWT